MNQSAIALNPLFEHVQKADSPLVMTSIYQPHINLVIWQRQLQKALQVYIDALTLGLVDLSYPPLLAAIFPSYKAEMMRCSCST